MVRLKDIFYFKHGIASHSIKLYKNRTSEDYIPYFRPSKSSLNVVAGYVKKSEIKPMYVFSKESLYIGTDGQGSHSYAYVSSCQFVPNSNILVLEPKVNIDIKQKLFYATAVTSNRWRFSYGRKPKAYRLKELKVPAPEELTEYSIKIKLLAMPTKEPYHYKEVSLNDRKWEWFKMKDIFMIEKGFYNRKPAADSDGEIPFIGATRCNNGVSSYHTLETIEQSTKTGNESNHPINEKIFKGGEYITLSNDGSAGYAFYQPRDFTCSHSVNSIRIKEKKIPMNPFIAMFLCTVMDLERFRWGYGRKSRINRMLQSKIKLPATPYSTPDWPFMEHYVKSLPYSKNLEAN